SVAIPGGGSVRCVPHRALGQVWGGASVFLAPLLGWEQTPLTALAALRHGVPVIASNRGSALELFDGAGLLLPLPDKLTPAATFPLSPGELGSWVETVLRLHDDPAFAAGQRGLALLAGQRWAAEQLAPQYARFLAGLATRRQRQRVSLNGQAVPRNGSAAALRRLAERHPWPNDRPE